MRRRHERGCHQRRDRAAPAPEDARPPEHHDFRTLPAPVRLDDVVTTHEAAAPPDPHAGRNPEQDFVLRYAGF